MREECKMRRAFGRDVGRGSIMGAEEGAEVGKGAGPACEAAWNELPRVCATPALP